MFPFDDVILWTNRLAAKGVAINFSTKTMSWIIHLDHPSNDNVIKWKRFSRYWPFVRGIHRSPVNSPHKGQWRSALTFSLICAWTHAWVNNSEAGDFGRRRAHYDVILMYLDVVMKVSCRITIKTYMNDKSLYIVWCYEMIVDIIVSRRSRCPIVCKGVRAITWKSPWLIVLKFCTHIGCDSAPGWVTFQGRRSMVKITA